MLFSAKKVATLSSLKETLNGNAEYEISGYSVYVTDKETGKMKEIDCVAFADGEAVKAISGNHYAEIKELQNKKIQ